MMHFFIALLAAAGVVLIWTVWATFRYQTKAFPDTTHYVTTADGWRIAINHYRAIGHKRQLPVVLCHGVGCNTLMFDLEGASLARWLAGSGYDVWSIDLRGNGFSEFPSSAKGKGFQWSCDTYLEQDIPAALAYITQKSGSPKVHWLGTSMGGNLILSYLSKGLGEKIKSITTVGSALDYSESKSDYFKLLPILKLFSWAAFLPVGFIFKLQAPLVGRVPNPIEAFNYYLPNVKSIHARQMHASGLHPVPIPVFQQLATLFEPGGMRSTTEDLHYFDNLMNIDTPVFTIAGDRDKQCPPDASEKTHAWMGSIDKKFQTFGIEQGHSTHYGHMDLLFGKAAETEVWSSIKEWLDRHN